MTLKDSQNNMYQHSEAKIKLLKLYLDRYLNILNLSPYIGDIYIYDLFCGKGFYQNNGKGSPIVILESIKEIHFANIAKGKNTGSFHCLFNDNDSSKIELLKKEIANLHLYYPEFGNLIFKEEDYQKLLPEVIKGISRFGNQKAFVFIDPYGYRDIKIADISNLLASGKSEVLLFLPTQFMFRFEEKGTPESLINFIDELIPYDKWPVSDTGIEFIETLTEAFRNKLGNQVFVDSFIITRDKNQFFCLFFFTSHILGFEKMLDSKWKLDESEGRGWSPNENNLFSSCEISPNTIKFEKNLEKYLLETWRTNKELYDFTLRNGHKTCHAASLLVKYQKEDRIDIINKDGNIARKGAFYLNYDNYKNQPDRIKLRLKPWQPQK